MEEFEVRVVTGKSPRKPGRLHLAVARVKAAGTALLYRPTLLVMGGLLAFVLALGTPHIKWNYECRVPGQAGGGCRYFDWCGYYGIQGRRVLFGDACKGGGLVKLLPIDWGRLFGSAPKPAPKTEYEYIPMD
jgi:hypothetical protein